MSADSLARKRAGLPPTDYGVFVWTAVNRYPRSAALSVYRHESRAQKAADDMNARREHGGMVVVRPVDRDGARANPHRANPRPARAARRNPPASNGVRVAQIHGQRATLVAVGLESLSYRHAQSRSHAMYAHEFNGDEQLWAMADGSLVIRHPHRRLWSDYIVPESE